MADQIGAAIARAERPQRFVGQIALGRPDRVVGFDVPVDITDAEVLGLIGALTGVRGQIAAQTGRSRLLMPTPRA